MSSAIICNEYNSHHRRIEWNWRGVRAQAAALGRNVFLVARSEDKLVTLCNELGRNNRVRAQYFALDLSQPESPALLFEEAEKRGLEVEMLINNAGFGSMGDFAKLIWHAN